MSISVIVPVWNGRELLERLMVSLDAQTRPAMEVLIVDNGSEDGAPEMAQLRGARVISMGRNAGFAAAVNAGIRQSQGDWVAVLNSDVELAPDYFEILGATDAWFVTGRILSSDREHIDGTFDAVCRGGTAWRVGSGRADGPAFHTRRAIASPPWTAALFRQEVFRRAGLLEEGFESYLEDVDFGLRCAARQMTGLYVPEAVAWHRGSASLGRWHRDTVRRISRNQVLLLARHYSGAMLLRYCWPIIVAQFLWGLVACRHGRPLAWLHGKWQGVANWRTARQGCDTVDSGLPEHFRDNEVIIRTVQRSTGFDLYWGCYFFLAGGGRK